MRSLVSRLRRTYEAIVHFHKRLPVFGQVATAGTHFRLHELDGIRGWAALVVILYHLFWEMFSVLVPGFRNPITALFLDGALAVSIFFVLSGEALSSGYFAGKGRGILKRLAIKRYPRLTIPIAAMTLIVWALHASGLTFNLEAGKLLPSAGLGRWLNFPLTAENVLSFPIYEVYLRLDDDHAINTFLWTMQTELFGSLLLLFLLYVLHGRSWGWSFLVALACVLLAIALTRDLSCFFFGAIFGALRMSGFFNEAQKSRRVQIASWLVIIFAATLNASVHFLYNKRMAQVTAVVLVFAFFCNRRCVQFFSLPFSQFLGRLSFPLYLMQLPVFLVLTSYLIILASRTVGLTLPVIWGIIAITVLACFAAAMAFYPVEIFTKWVCDRMPGNRRRA